MAKLRIVLADDHELFRQGLKSLVNKDPSMVVVGEARNGEELLKVLKTVKCDVVVTDLTMPVEDGMLAIQKIREKFPKYKVLVLTMQKDHEHFKRAMKFGANGYLLKDDAFEQFTTAVRMIMKNKRFVSASVSTLLADRFIRSLGDVDSPVLEILTKRELQILELIANGQANKNVASKLKLSVRTIETHRANLSNKLGIKNTAGLVRFAVSKGLV